MTPMPKSSSSHGAALSTQPGEPDDLAVLGAVLSVAATPMAPEAGAEHALRSRLMERVSKSAQQHRCFENWRHGDGVWQALAPGVRANTLHADAHTHTQLVEFGARSTWQPGGQARVQEFIVLRGALHVGQTRLHAHDYHLQGRLTPDAGVHCEEGALVFMRTSLPGASAFGDTDESRTVHIDEEAAWQPLRRGVLIKTLFEAAGRSSIVARLAPGAHVPGHAHAVGEECLMVQGELFLGDVLLREGEFQWAPAGSAHDGLYTDTGCLLFFHGAVDPVVVDPGVTLEQVRADF